MDNKKFNGFMVFMLFVCLLLFLSISDSFAASLVSALVLVVILRACWMVYEFLFDLIGGVDLEKLRKHGKFKKREI